MMKLPDSDQSLLREKGMGIVSFILRRHIRATPRFSPVIAQSWRTALSGFYG